MERLNGYWHIYYAADRPGGQVGERVNKDGWDKYLSRLEGRVGTLNDYAKRALKGFYEERKRIEHDWNFEGISVKERTDRRFALGQKFGREHGKKIDQDERFRDAVGIVRDESG